MRKVYVIESEDAYKSLRAELKDEGVEWVYGEKASEEYDYQLEIVSVENKRASRIDMAGFLAQLGRFGITGDMQISVYKTDPKYISQTIKEVLTSDWDEDWKIRFEHPNYKNNDGFQKFGTLLRSLANGYGEEVAHDILATGRFFIDRGE